MKTARENYGNQFLAYFRSRLKIPTIDYDAWTYALRWLSICADLAHYQRGHWAYAWVLSGYSASVVTGAFGTRHWFAWRYV
jgi:hypothetical protein